MSPPTLFFVAEVKKRLSRDARWSQLLDTAEALFLARGYDSTTMEDIATAAGVTRAVVYAHFQGKEEILLAGARRARAELDAKLTQLASDATPDAELSDVVHRGGDIFFSLLENTPSRWALLFAASAANPVDGDAELHRLRSSTIRHIIDVVARVQPQVGGERIEAMAYMVSGVGEQLGRWWLTHPEVPRKQVVHYYSDFIVRGLGTTRDRR